MIGAARPLVAMLWARETEGHVFDTPERRAALEARIGEVINAIADEAVRRYYREDFRTRLQQFFAPAQAPREPWRNGARGGGQRRDWPQRAGGPSPGHRPAATRPTWWPVSNWRQARCIAATLRRCRGVKR